MILFLHGPDTFRSRQKLREIVLRYQAVHPGVFSFKDFDCARADFSDFTAEVEAVPLFEKKRLIVLRNALSSARFDKAFVEYAPRLAKLKDHTIVFFEEGEVKEKSKNALYQFLKKHARSQEFSLLAHAALMRWIQKEFAGYQIPVEPDAVEMLAKTVGSDLWRLSNEIRKVATFAKSKTPLAVQTSDVALLVGGTFAADIFATIDALAQKNRKQALVLLWRHMAQGDSPHYLLGMLMYQFRTILQVKDMVERGMLPGAIPQKSKLHPYVVKKSLRAAQDFSIQKLKQIYKKLFDLELSVKTGKIEPEATFDLFVASL